MPRWPVENACFSCHHNGDAARALFTARRLGREVPRQALSTTERWLLRPDRWYDQKGDPAFSDKSLSRYQFAAALAAAAGADVLRDRRALEAAGDLVASLQGSDGSFTVEPRDAMGSPATWGTYLATAMSCRTLQDLEGRRFASAVQRGRAWLRAAPVRNDLEAAAVLLGAGDAARADSWVAECLRAPNIMGSEPICEHRRAGCAKRAPGDLAEPIVERERQSRRPPPPQSGQKFIVLGALSMLERGRAPRGGWGPFASSPPEPFDTAVVILALMELAPSPRVSDWIAEGRAYLMASQEDDGSWPATTRPRGGESYAQEVSTSSWAALALMAGVSESPDRP